MRYLDIGGTCEVVVRPQLLERMTRLCARNPEVETGGILLGKYSPDCRTAIVSDVSSAPADSQSSRWEFKRGVSGLSRLLRRKWQSGSGYYIGEWHFHPASSPTPSARDRKQMAEISAATSYACVAPVLVIIGGTSLDHPEVFVGYYDPSSRQLIELLECSMVAE